MTFKIPDDLRPLLMKRQIALVGDVTGDRQEIINASIIYLNALGENPITFFIDSCGGSTTSGMLICDAVENSIAPIHALVTGFAYSAAFYILQVCDRRLAYAHSQLMLHATKVEWRIDDPNLDEYIKKVTALYQERLEMISSRSGQNKERLKKWGKKEKIFSAEEALKLGFLDGITRPSRKKR